MVAALTVTPTTPFVSTTPSVAGTGFTDTYKTRLLLDGIVQMVVCYPSGGVIAGSVTVQDSAGTQTLTAQQYIGGVWTTVATLVVTIVAASSETFSADDPLAFRAVMEDLSVNVIQLAAGTYHDWQVYMRINRTSSHPITVKPAAGAAVIWDGSGLGLGGANGLFYFGANSGLPGVPTAVTDYITFDTAGTGGSFTIQNYHIGSTGLIYTGWVDNLTLNGFTVTGCSGDAAQNQSHCLYVSSDDTHHATNITANSWNITGDTARTLNGVQLFHNPNVTTIGMASWTVTKLHRWAYLWGDASGITVDGWSGTNCDATIDAIVSGVNNASGTVKNSNAHGSCGPLSRGTYGSGGNFWSSAGSVTDGGGNSA